MLTSTETRQETGPTAYRPSQKILECLTIYRRQSKGSIFSSVIYDPECWFGLRVETSTSRRQSGALRRELTKRYSRLPNVSLGLCFLSRKKFQKVQTVYNVNNEMKLIKTSLGKNSAQPHTSLCMHIFLAMNNWIIKPHICIHNEVWGCAEIFFPSLYPSLRPCFSLGLCSRGLPCCLGYWHLSPWKSSKTQVFCYLENLD